MTVSCELRLATRSEAEAVANLLSQLYRHYNWPSHSWNINDVLSYAQRIISSSAMGVVLALVNDKPTGIALFTETHPSAPLVGTLYLKDIFIAEEYRGKGIGSQLMSYVAHIASERRCARFEWTVDQSNTTAISLYEKIGATHVKQKLFFRLEGTYLEQLAKAGSIYASV